MTEPGHHSAKSRDYFLAEAAGAAAFEAAAAGAAFEAAGAAFEAASAAKAPAVAKAAAIRAARILFMEVVLEVGRKTHAYIGQAIPKRLCVQVG